MSGAPLDRLRRVPGRSRLAEALGVYVILDVDTLAGRSLLDVAQAVIQGGAGAVQLRAKRWDGGQVLEAARRIRPLAEAAGVLFIVNDRVDVAWLAGAGGAHLGESDIPVAEARRLLGPDAVIGFSPDDLDSARRAVLAGADYLGVGPAYGTATKPDAGPAIGPEGVGAVARALPVPVVGIGGINAANAAAVIAAGACGVAVASAVLRAPDVSRAVHDLALAVRAARSGRVP